jgi:glycosyltransferase involved in cell wall biosynthesis
MANIASGLPSVCVVVPTFNRPTYLVETIKSLLAQTVSVAQIVVADDGSTVETRKALSAFGSRVKHDWAPNAGKAAALNRVMRGVTEEFVWIFDDDDIADPRALERLHQAIVAKDDVQFAYAPYDHLIEIDGSWVTRALDLPRPDTATLKTAIMERCFIFQPGMLVRRSAYEKVGPFREALARSQDYEMLLRLTRWSAGVRVDQIAFHQRQHAGDRGPSFARAAAGKSEAGWAAYDQQIFERVYDDYALSEYLPQPAPLVLLPEQHARALVQRACIMARKGLWLLAARDIEELSAVLKEAPAITVDLTAFSRVFGEKSYALADVEMLPAFVTALATLPGGVRRRIVGRLFWTLGTGVKWALTTKKPKRAVKLVSPLVKITLALLR